MLFAAAHIRIAAEYGTATLWLDFPGEPVNALDLIRLRELDAGLAAIETNPAIQLLVVRSAKPAGFCAGIHPDALASLTTAADRAAFAWTGQQVFDRLAALPFPTVAFLDGPCLGAGVELALACDHRLCVARPTTHLGFPNAVPCFGGSVRLPARIGRRNADRLLASGRTLSGREARSLRLVDHAFCERRAKIELRTFLDQLEVSTWRAGERKFPGGSLCGFAGERRKFAASCATVPVPELAFPPFTTRNPIPPFPAVVGMVGEAASGSGFAAQVALRGGEVIIRGNAARVFAGIAVALARGFVTPLEAEQARSRVKPTAEFKRCGLVLASGPAQELPRTIRPRCLVATVAGPGTVRSDRADPDTLATLAAWLTPFGFTVAAPAHFTRAAA